MRKEKYIVAVLITVLLLIMTTCREYESELDPHAVNHQSPESLNITPQTLNKISEDTATQYIPRININKTDGAIILKTIPEIIEKDLNLGNLYMEYRLPYIDNAYCMYLYTLTDEYELKLSVPKDTDITDFLDYNTMSLDIRNKKTDEILHNPDNSELFDEFWYTSYFKQREQWESEILKPKYSGNFACVLNPNHCGAFEYVDIPDDLADQIVYELQNTTKQVKIIEYTGSEDEFINMGIEVFLEDMNYEYSVLMWVNRDGTKAIGMGGNYIPVSDLAYDLIVDLLEDEICWEEGWLPKMQDIVSIELIYKDQSIGIVTDINEINEISEMLYKSKCIIGGSKCPFEAELLYTKNDGSKFSLRLATDDCPIIVAGSSTYYDFGEVNSMLGSKQEVKFILLRYFGIERLSP